MNIIMYKKKEKRKKKNDMSKTKKLNKVNVFKAIAIAISIINIGFLFGITLNDILGQGTYNVLKYSGSIIFFMQIFNFVVIFKLIDSFKKNVDKGIMVFLVSVMIISTFFMPVERVNYNNVNKSYSSYDNIYGIRIGEE